MNFTKKYIDDIYTDKAFHWLMFLDTNNLWYMTKKSLNKPVSKYNQLEAYENYHKINDQIINCFGLDQSFKEAIELDMKIALLKLEYIETGNGIKQTLYEIEEAKKNKIPKKESSNKIDVNKEIGIISKYLGGGIIDIKNVTIHQYLTAKKLIKDG